MTLDFDAGTVNTATWRYQKDIPFNGTQTLILDGSAAGGDAATLSFNDARGDRTYTFLGAVFGGVAVPAGSYTIGTDYADYLIHGSSSEHTLTFEVLTLAPEPASVALLGLGGAMILVRRRPRA